MQCALSSSRAALLTPRTASAASSRAAAARTQWVQPARTHRFVAARGSAHPNIVEVDAEGLEVAVNTRERAMVIDFYATWCGPCLLLAKELEKVAETLGDDIRILKLDTDKHPEISSQLHIYGLPTMMFVPVDGRKPILRTEGLLPADTIMEIVREELMAQGTADTEATPQA